MTAKGKREFFANAVQHPIELLQAVSALMESGSRLGEFKLALEAGGQERGIVRRLAAGLSTRRVDEESLTRATLAARDVTTDFSRGGHTARELNRIYAFFNAGVQGKVRMVETIKRDPVGDVAQGRVARGGLLSPLDVEPRRRRARAGEEVREPARVGTQHLLAHPDRRDVGEGREAVRVGHAREPRRGVVSTSEKKRDQGQRPLRARRRSTGCAGPRLGRRTLALRRDSAGAPAS